MHAMKKLVTSCGLGNESRAASLADASRAANSASARARMAAFFEAICTHIEELAERDYQK